MNSLIYPKCIQKFSSDFLPLFCTTIIFIHNINCVSDINTSRNPDNKILEPKVVIGNTYWPDSFTKEEQAHSETQIRDILQNLIHMIVKKDLRDLPGLIHPKNGLWIDLKSHRSYTELINEIQKKDGYLQKFYLETELLQKHTGDITRISLRDIFISTKVVRADIYPDPDGQKCEIKIFIVDSPAYNFQFNQAYFIKINNDWKLLRLF